MDKKNIKERLDILLVEKNIFESRERAKLAIMEGLIFVNNQKEDKAGTKVDVNSLIEYREKGLMYVSRGGYKLEKAIKVFNIDLKDRVCIDIGSSTGGFTDCMLKNGAKKVYAVDCGTNQLAYKLRNDERVLSFENVNARYLDKNIIDDRDLSFVSIDVSFISLKKIFPVLEKIFYNNFYGVSLIKPQFEVGRENVGDGVIRDEKLRVKVIIDIINFVRENNIYPIALDYSPIKGPKGNIEYLLYFKKEKEEKNLITDEYICEVVKKSQVELEG